MLGETSVVQQNSSVKMHCVSLLLTVSCLLMAGASLYQSTTVIHHLTTQTQSLMNTQHLIATNYTQTPIKPTNEAMTPNITHIIYCYKRMFQYTNLMYDMLQANKELGHLRTLVDDVTKPVFISNESPMDKDTYKEIFLITIRKLAANNLSEEEQKLIIYAHDFVNIYLSIEM